MHMRRYTVKRVELLQVKPTISVYSLIYSIGIQSYIQFVPCLNYLFMWTCWVS